MKHDGKVALVTGGANGIGLACVEALIAEGAKVVILDRDARTCQDAASRFGGKASAITADLTGLDGSRAAALVEEARKVFNRLDILVNNAGVVKLAHFLDIDAADFDLMMDVNVRAPMLIAQAATRVMIDQGSGGAIVNISSVTAELASPQAAGYAASKGAMRQLTRAMALDLIQYGIRVNAVGPGTIATGLAAEAVLNDAALKKAIMSRTPAGRLGAPMDIANAVSFLASEDSAYIIGQTIYVDGGRLVLNYTVPESH